MSTKKLFNSRAAVFVTVLVGLMLAPSLIWADLKLPAVISDNMVLQQRSTVPIWGWAKAGEEIRITTSWDRKVIETTADPNGVWIVKIETPQSGGTHELTFQDDDDFHIVKNILLGEVWLCSGQSNMEMPLGKGIRNYGGVNNYKQEIASADYPDIRLFFEDRKSTPDPQPDCSGVWTACSPKTAEGFSAVAYFFGRELYKKLNVPIGLIDSSWGGTPAEAWTSRKTLESAPEFKAILSQYDKAVANYPNAENEYKQKMKLWEKALAEVKMKSEPLPAEPLAPIGLGHYQSPAGLFNGMISPLIPYEIKGVIWYQGESNVGRAYQYRTLFPALIRDWRSRWEQDFPFYYVQIAPWLGYEGYKGPASEELREAQLLTLSIPNTGMVVTTDIGDINDVHPKNKQEVGRRLALWALAKTYGETNIVYSGPLYRSMDIEDDKIRISFDHIGSGLVAKDSKLDWFTIAGEDRKFVSANAIIDGNEVVVWSAQVKKPIAVRFGWDMTAQPNLFNKEGLPASLFRTDDWPRVSINNR